MKKLILFAALFSSCTHTVPLPTPLPCAKTVPVPPNKSSTISKCCDFQISRDSRLVYSKNLKKYAIMFRADWSESRIMYVTHDTEIGFATYGTVEPALFDDSCQAKGYFKECLKQMHIIPDLK